MKYKHEMVYKNGFRVWEVLGGFGWMREDIPDLGEFSGEGLLVYGDCKSHLYFFTAQGGHVFTETKGAQVIEMFLHRREEPEGQARELCARQHMIVSLGKILKKTKHLLVLPEAMRLKRQVRRSGGPGGQLKKQHYFCGHATFLSKIGFDSIEPVVMKSADNLLNCYYDCCKFNKPVQKWKPPGTTSTF